MHGFPMNYLFLDTYNHNGEHISIVQDCLCNHDTETIVPDYEREILICTDCGHTRKMLTYHHMLTEKQNIESWMLKTGL